VEVVPNGADAAMFDPSADGDAFLRSYPEERRKLEGKFIFLYAGAHGLSNDLNVLLDTAGILREQPEIAIVLIGDGKEKPNLIARANQMGLPNVYFFPPVPKTLMPQALAAADACIAILKPVPLYATVYPNKVFDYLAAGRPVILAIDGEIRKVIEQARAGIFVQPGDPGALAQALRTLAANPNMRREMGMNGRRYMEANFDRPKTAEKLARIMENLIKV
jgi:glycosyltransferase involved in cell wall biosynthesis